MLVNELVFWSDSNLDIIPDLHTVIIKHLRRLLQTLRVR